MPRPRKCRRICRMPNATQYGPAGGSSQTITLSVDEFECIRLLDYEGLTQEQAALQMGVARATVTFIYEAARRKIADALVNGRQLQITGGNYKLCENAGNCCGRCERGCCETCENTACKSFLLQNQK